VIRRDVGTAVAAAVATLLGAVALTPVFRSGSWFGPVLATVVVVLTGGLLLRAAGPALWARVSGGRPVPQRLQAVGVPLVPVGQLALVCCLLTSLYAPDAALAGVVPTPTSLGALADVLADGAVQMQEQSTPAVPLHGLVALTVVLVGFVAVAVDLVAVAGGQPALAGLGLLVPYCVPVSTITGGIGLVALAAPAAGLALLLWADQHRRLARRPRPGRRSVLGTGGLVAVRTGALALVAGLVLGAVVPTLAEGALTGGTGDGPGGGATGTALDPVAEMRGQLTLPEPIDLLRVTASVDDPGYFRAVTLDRYDARSGWTLTSLDGDASIAGDGSLAPLPDGEPSRVVDATITALEHDDRFMPLPYSPQSVTVTGGDDRGWRFDPATSTVFGRGTTTAGQSWRVDAEEPEPTTDLLAASPALPATSSVLARYTELPALDPSVTALVSQLTDGLGTPYERVRAIHGYLTDRANGFVYSLSTAPGTGGDDLADFLRLRRGYCEQYAGAMAVLVRAAGVPARVALGYTPGATEPDGTRLISSDDAHAWVEVYFDGLGWVPFDPTPIEPARAVALPWAPRGDAAPSPDETATAPTTVAPSLPAPTLSNGETDTSITLGSAADDTGTVLAPLLLGTGAVLLVVALLAAPAAARALQRRRRLADGSPGALWDELAATALDLGIGLHASATPRQAARHLAELVARGDGGGVHRRGVRRPDDGTAAADALRCLALAEETASYARPGTAVASAELGEALRTARRGLLRGAARTDRLRARLWPVSLLRGSGRRGAEALGRWIRAVVRRRPSAA
jgi:transglutaminase-like putative cysteine protease